MFFFRRARTWATPRLHQPPRSVSIYKEIKYVHYYFKMFILYRPMVILFLRRCLLSIWKQIFRSGYCSYLWCFINIQCTVRMYVCTYVWRNSVLLNCSILTSLPPSVLSSSAGQGTWPPLAALSHTGPCRYIDTCMNNLQYVVITALLFVHVCVCKFVRYWKRVILVTIFLMIVCMRPRFHSATGKTFCCRLGKSKVIVELSSITVIE